MYTKKRPYLVCSKGFLYEFMMKESLKNIKCLVLDHDDTIVDSTRTVHYPAFVDYLDIHYPGVSKNYTLESYLVKNFHPGVIALFHDELGMSFEEMKREEAFWNEYVRTRVPRAFDGIREIIADFKAQGGIVAIDSHSLKPNIERDLRENGIIPPDIIYGWELPREQRKPSPYTLLDLCERYALKPEEILVVDDLKPGFDMARAAGTHFAAAGWAYDVPEIESFMRAHCDYYLESVSDLRTLLFG